MCRKRRTRIDDNNAREILIFRSCFPLRRSPQLLLSAPLVDCDASDDAKVAIRQLANLHNASAPGLRNARTTRIATSRMRSLPA